MKKMPLFLLPLAMACHCPKTDPPPATVPAPETLMASDFTPWLRIDPTEAEVASGAAFAFRPNLNYPKGRYYMRPPVKWSVQEAAGGSIDAMGHYTAPAAPGTYHVIVERTDVEGIRAIATVTVK